MKGCICGIASDLPYIVEEPRGQALRKGAWKYIPSGTLGKRELYNLDADIGEQDNVISSHPEVAREMDTLLKKIINGNGIRTQ
jgi:hypothetical protein